MILGLDKIDKNALAAIDCNDVTITYGDICALTDNIKELLHERELCFLFVENTCGSMAWIMASLASERLVPLILNVHTEQSLVNSLLETYKPSLVGMPEGCELKENLAALNLKEIGDRHSYTVFRTCHKLAPMHPSLSHLLPTSGSTGSPKLVRHMYDNVEAAGLNISTFFELTVEDKPLLVLPLYYTMGLSVVFSHLKVGATVLLTHLNMTDPRFWAFIKDQEATSFTGVPYSFQILNLMRFFRMKLPKLELLTQGGGKMPTDLNLKFAEYCRDNGKRWIATYGQSECTARMTYLPAKWAVEKIGSIGIAVPNGELSLIDDEGNEIHTPHVEGEMCYRGKNVTMGYATTINDLQLGDERHGFNRTGDLAYFDEDGCYYIVGRMGRFLKLFGMRVGLDECEQIIQSNCSGMECACVGTDEKMIVYITDESKKLMVKELLVDKTHIVATSFEVRVINEIPKNETGKKQYKKLPME